MSKRRPFVGDRLLTVGEVAATMRVSNMTVYRLIKSGQLAAIREPKLHVGRLAAELHPVLPAAR